MATRVLINCDDFGMHPTINDAIIEILEGGLISSVSILPTAPYFQDAANAVKRFEWVSVGVHLALSAEYKNLPLRPVLPTAAVGSLCMIDGRFYPDFFPISTQARAEEIAAELRAQIETVLATGIPISHLDSHMFFNSPQHAGLETFELTRNLANEYGVPLRGAAMVGGERIPTHMIWDNYDTADERQAFYQAYLESRPANSVQELLIHPAKSSEMLATFTAAGEKRLSDYCYFTSSSWLELAQRLGFEVVNWSNLGEIINSRTVDDILSQSFWSEGMPSNETQRGLQEQ